MKLKERIVVFVNPPIRKEEQYGELSSVGGFDPHFGLCYLASTVRKKGYKPFIIDAPVLNYDIKKTIHIILGLNPSYICITATTYAIISAIALAMELKKKTRAKIIIGGPHFSAMPKETIEYFDIGVVNEGESTIAELLDALEDKKPLKNIKGIIYKSKGKIIVNKLRPFIKNLDALPMPAFDLLPEITKYYQPPVQSVIRYPFIGLISSRGCSGQCTFCDRRVFGNRLRAHSAKYLFKLIKHLVDEYKIKSFIFYDDNFLIFKKRNLELLELIRRNKIDIKFTCLARVDMIEKEYLTKLKKGGLWQVNLGIESGSQMILDFYKKNITLKQVKKAVDTLHSLGIRCKGFFMLGNPLETKQTLEQTRKFAKMLDLTDISITYFTPLPGSNVGPYIKKYGRIIQSFDKFSMFEVVFIPKGLKKEDLEFYYRTIYKEFYLRPRIILDYAKRINSFKQVKYFAKALEVFSKHILRS